MRCTPTTHGFRPRDIVLDGLPGALSGSPGGSGAARGPRRGPFSCVSLLSSPQNVSPLWHPLRERECFAGLCRVYRVEKTPRIERPPIMARKHKGQHKLQRDPNQDSRSADAAVEFLAYLSKRVAPGSWLTWEAGSVTTKQEAPSAAIRKGLSTSTGMRPARWMHAEA